LACETADGSRRTGSRSSRLVDIIYKLAESDTVKLDVTRLVAPAVLRSGYNRLRSRTLKFLGKAYPLPLGCLGRCFARGGRLFAQGVTVATAHAGDVPNQLLPGLDVILRSDGNLFHDR